MQQTSNVDYRRYPWAMLVGMPQHATSGEQSLPWSSVCRFIPALNPSPVHPNDPVLTELDFSAGGRRTTLLRRYDVTGTDRNLHYRRTPTQSQSTMRTLSAAFCVSLACAVALSANASPRYRGSFKVDSAGEFYTCNASILLNPCSILQLCHDQLSAWVGNRRFHRQPVWEGWNLRCR